jgi:hypothetical protein
MPNLVALRRKMESAKRKIAKAKNRAESMRYLRAYHEAYQRYHRAAASA